MKSKFFNLITVSLATSILLAPVQEAFGFGAELKTNIKEIQHSVQDVESRPATNSEEAQNQKLVHKGKTTKSEQSHRARLVAADSQTSDTARPRAVEPSIQASNTVGGVFVTFLFTSYILVGLQYRKYRTHRATVLLQQIETLERIWRMKPQQR
jgi:hypothetical protein